MNDYQYDIKEKEKCWYKSICNKERCGETFCIRHYKMDALVHMATMEGNQKYPIQLKLDKEGTDRDAYKLLKDIQNSIVDFVTQGKNLLIYSEFTGNGKTEWAKKLMLSWFDNIWPTTDFECRGLFVSVPKLMAAMKENITSPNEYFQYINDNIINADLVVWDEINYKDYSTFEHDYMLNVISQRHTIGKANIYTTNFDIPQISQKLGARLGSRIIGASIQVKFKGQDKRGWGLQ